MKLVQTCYDKNCHRRKKKKKGTVMSEMLFHSRDLFAVRQVCFESDIIQGLAGMPQWGL